MHSITPENVAVAQDAYMVGYQGVENPEVLIRTLEIYLHQDEGDGGEYVCESADSPNPFNYDILSIVFQYNGGGKGSGLGDVELYSYSSLKTGTGCGVIWASSYDGGGSRLIWPQGSGIGDDDGNGMDVPWNYATWKTRLWILKCEWTTLHPVRP